MPARTERYRFMRWEIEDVDGAPRTLPGGYAHVTRRRRAEARAGRVPGPRAARRGPRCTSRGGHVRKLEQFGFASRVTDADSA